MDKLLKDLVEGDQQGTLHALLKDMATTLAKQDKLNQGQQTEIDKLKKQQTVQQVAFSTALLASGKETVGPFKENTDLIFKYVPTNIGNAYDPKTGVVTAPVKGAYQFQWSVSGQGGDDFSGVVLFKDPVYYYAAHSRHTSGFTSVSNAITLILEVGDTVRLRLWSNNKVYDDINHATTFSGHLLFPM